MTSVHTAKIHKRFLRSTTGLTGALAIALTLYAASAQALPIVHPTNPQPQVHHVAVQPTPYSGDEGTGGTGGSSPPPPPPPPPPPGGGDSGTPPPGGGTQGSLPPSIFNPTTQLTGPAGGAPGGTGGGNLGNLAPAAGGFGDLGNLSPSAGGMLGEISQGNGGLNPDVVACLNQRIQQDFDNPTVSLEDCGGSGASGGV